MQRYMIHLQNNRFFTPRDATVLLYNARELAQDPEVIVRDARVSTRYIEFDVSVPDNVTIDDMIRRLEAISRLASYEQIVESHMEKEQAIKRAVHLFNDEKYWGAHEALESVWKTTTNVDEKGIINGIILVAAAFVHDEKDEPEICLSILRRAMKKLEGATGMYRGIDIDRIANRISRIISSGKIDRFTI